MIRIEIKTGNDAFEGHSYYPEIARILRKLADRVDTLTGSSGMMGEWPLLDSNGNTVGSCEFSFEPPDRLTEATREIEP